MKSWLNLSSLNRIDFSRRKAFNATSIVKLFEEHRKVFFSFFKTKFSEAAGKFSEKNNPMLCIITKLSAVRITFEKKLLRVNVHSSLSYQQAIALQLITSLLRHRVLCQRS